MPSSVSLLPKHVAVIMDGNGRWAKARFLPRAEGHRRGVGALKRLTEAAAKHGIEILTVFAFSSENWGRPASEVSMLMNLFSQVLARWSQPLKDADVRLRVIGDTTAFPDDVQAAIARSEALTADCSRMVLNVAANYGGRWDMCRAARLAAEAGEAITPESISAHLAAPDVDLLIRTGGEQRISNFLLWQSAYAELYCTDTLWPDFCEEDFVRALRWYEGRERRFGKTSEQVRAA